MNSDLDAILITSTDDLEYLEKHNTAAGIASEYPIIQLNESTNLDYFLNDLDVGINLYEFVGDLISNWYRNEEGIDVGRMDLIFVSNMPVYGDTPDYIDVIFFLDFLDFQYFSKN